MSTVAANPLAASAQAAIANAIVAGYHPEVPGSLPRVFGRNFYL